MKTLWLAIETLVVGIATCGLLCWFYEHTKETHEQVRNSLHTSSAAMFQEFNSLDDNESRLLMMQGMIAATQAELKFDMLTARHGGKALHREKWYALEQYEKQIDGIGGGNGNDGVIVIPNPRDIVRYQ